jgi:diguanylate cyclase (GGDEF)-like protein
MLWKKKGAFDEVAPSSPSAVKLGVCATARYKELVILPNDPISQDFCTKIDSLCKDATSAEATDQTFEQVADVLGQVVDHFARSQRKAIEKSIEATHDSLREVLLSLDGAVSSGDALEEVTEQSSVRMTKLTEAQSFEDVVKGLKDEAKILSAAIQEHKESSRVIRNVCTSQINDLRSKLRVAERSVRTDNLTKLSNRSAFDFMLATAINKTAVGDEYYLAVLDLNDFKLINDTHGHLAGDAALVLFAQRLSETFGVLGGNGTQVARLGGDEFAVVFKGTKVQLEAKLERVNNTLEKKPLQFKLETINMSASYGIVQLRSTITPASAFHEADVRMYQCKQARKAA